MDTFVAGNRLLSCSAKAHSSQSVSVAGAGRAEAQMTSEERCFACGKRLGKRPHKADTRDDQIVYVGQECWRLIILAGDSGYQPPRGGPRLYPFSKFGDGGQDESGFRSEDDGYVESA